MTKAEKAPAVSKAWSREERITQGPLFSSILIFVIPIILANVMQTLFNAVDMVMVNFFSESGTEVASIGCTGPLLHLFKNLSIGISVGTSILLARYLGAKEEEITRAICRKAIEKGIPLEINFGKIASKVESKMPLDELKKRIPYPSPEFWKIVAEETRNNRK